MEEGQSIEFVADTAQRVQQPRDHSLQLALWGVWTFIVVGVGVWTWWPTFMAQQPLSIIDLIVRCTFTGLLGLIVITLIEQRVEPWRFIDSAPRIR